MNIIKRLIDYFKPFEYPPLNKEIKGYNDLYFKKSIVKNGKLLSSDDLNNLWVIHHRMGTPWDDLIRDYIKQDIKNESKSSS
jgi:hypothetical protein